MRLLTARQLRFVNEYLIDGNGTQAAIRAGYSRKTARSIASENLMKPQIALTIRRYEMQASDYANAGRRHIVQMLARLAFSDFPGIFNTNGSLKHPKVWPSDVSSKIGRLKLNASRKRLVKNRVAAEALNTNAERLKVLGALASYLKSYGLLDA